jgi:hypothetical protein
MRRPRGDATLAGMEASVDLYWLPLGAGGHSVRLNGRVYEAVVAAVERRGRCDLYHSALEVELDGVRHVIESAPVPRGGAARYGVVAEGPVGTRSAGRLRIFRYGVRCWRGGSIPDLAEAVDSPRRVSEDPAVARRILELAPQVPTPVWGRDELAAGEMWNSNSLISWLIVCSGLPVDSIAPPTGGRAPGWRAGIAVARRGQSGQAPSGQRGQTPLRVTRDLRCLDYPKPPRPRGAEEARS